MRHWFWGWLQDSVLQQNRDIGILYERTDKRLREFEAERKIRVLLQKRVSKLENDLRKRNSQLKGLRKRILGQLKEEEKNEKVL